MTNTHGGKRTGAGRPKHEEVEALDALGQPEIIAGPDWPYGKSPLERLSHGGKRPRAGRPKQVDTPIRRTVYLDQRHVDYIDQYFRLKHPNTFSQALRCILNDYMDWPETHSDSS